MKRGKAFRSRRRRQHRTTDLEIGGWLDAILAPASSARSSASGHHDADGATSGYIHGTTSAPPGFRAGVLEHGFADTGAAITIP